MSGTSDPEIAPESEPPTIVSAGTNAQVGPSGEPHPPEGVVRRIAAVEAAAASNVAPSSAADGSHGPEVPLSKKPRSKMTLRIPDDEVARPSSQTTPDPISVVAPVSSAVGPLPPVSAPPLAPHRIITVSTPTTQIEVPAAAPRATAPSVPAALPDEDSWTPYQPTAIEHEIPAPPDSVDIPIDSGPDPDEPPEPVAPPRKLPPVSAPPISARSPAVRPVSAAPPPPEPEPARVTTPQPKPVAAVEEPPAPAPSAPPQDATPPGPATPLRPAASSPPPPAIAAEAEPSPAVASISAADSIADVVFEDDTLHSPLPDSSLSAAMSVEPPPPAVTIVVKEPASDSVAARPVAKAPLPPARPRATATMDPEELGHEPDPGRVSEPPEISPEDVVSVEPAADKPRSSPSGPPPPMRPRATSNPGFSVAPPVRPTSTPRVPTKTVKMAIAPPDGVPSPSPPPAPHAAAPPVPRVPPLVIVPGVSPLAPPPMSDTAATARKRVRPWWEDLFNDDFIRTMARITDRQIAKEVDFIEDSLGLDKGAMVLDLACGTGRHAIELTRRGYQVVGFDLSLAMLAKAADEAQDRQQKLNFVQGDMREMTFDGTFDGVYCWATSFGFFEEEKNTAVIANIQRALKPGGQLLLDVVNRDFVAQQSPSMVWFEGDGCVCMDDMSIDWITSRMKIKRTMMMDDGRSREIEYSIRIYSLHELGKMLHDSGFRVAQVSGRLATPGVFLGADSPRTLILAEKK